MRYALTVVVLLCLTSIAVPAEPSAVGALHALFDSEWEYTMRDSPEWASELGDLRFNKEWTDLSLAAYTRRHQHCLQVLAQLRSMNRGALPAAEQLNYDLFRGEYERDLQGDTFRGFLLPISQESGIQLLDGFVSSLRFDTEQDYLDWIARLQGFSAHMQQVIALMRQGIRERRVYPRVVMQRVSGQIDSQITEPQKSTLYRPFLKFPTTVPLERQRALQEAARQAIAQSVLPAYAELKKFFVSEYLPACYSDVGVWQDPDGDRYYGYLIRYHTTTSLSAAEIHDIGLREVARIRAKMEEVMRTCGYRGTLPEFFHYLRTDPRFFYQNADDLLAAYRALAKRIDPRLVKVFRILPRTPYGVEPIPSAGAADSPTAYYYEPAADGSRAGTYYVNVYQPQTRPRWEMTALSLHESVPGHHLQIALSQEQGDLPKFRRHGSYTAYVEGWGLYAESLGEQMGLYDDPYDRFGQLTLEMWRAVRLVVDTGMHSMHWSRQRAIRFFLDNTPRSELDVTNEIDRYIVWPGQALAYKIGQLKILQLRERARSALGQRFDIRDFHDVVLRNGAVPLDLLEKSVDSWISERAR